MRAMVLEKIGEPLRLKEDLPNPQPGPGQVLIQVHRCGVCRTDLHIIDNELPPPSLPLILGHQIVGEIVECGPDVTKRKVGDRVGAPWLAKSCKSCSYCKEGKENLCNSSLYMGYHRQGGYAEYCVAEEDFCFPIPDRYPDDQAAPLLCAGLIGYRSLRFTENAPTIGFYGFGAAAHILTQVAIYQGKKVYAFTRKGDTKTQNLAKKLGAVWAGDSEEKPPESLDAAIIFAPVGDLIPTALKALRKGGRVVLAGIHMSDIPSFPYSILWGERMIRSVANLTREDGKEFLDLAPKVPVKTEVACYKLEQANEALEDLRKGKFFGSAVLQIS